MVTFESQINMKIITETKTPGDPLLRSFKLGHLTLRNRIMSTSHACGLGDSDHMPGEAYQAYHLAKAQGGLALTMFGGSANGGRRDLSKTLAPK